MPIQTAAERQGSVHQVTLVQVSWTEEEGGARGALTLQLIVDNEAEDYVLRAAPGDAAVLLEGLAGSTKVMLDLGPRAPMLGSLPTSSPRSPSRGLGEAAFMKT